MSHHCELAQIWLEKNIESKTGTRHAPINQSQRSEQHHDRFPLFTDLSQTRREKKSEENFCSFKN